MRHHYQRSTQHGLDSDAAEDWRDGAACRREDPELFFPVGTDGPAKRQALGAIAVCRRCDVREDCLKWARDKGIRHGVWGGQDMERRQGNSATCGKGHVRTEENTYYAPVTGWVECRQCRTERDRKRREAKAVSSCQS